MTQQPARPLSPARRSRNARIAAFTLVEVMAAMVVMLIAVSSTLVVMNYGIRGVDTARNSILASQIMQSELERVRLMPWTDLTTLQASGATDVSLTAFADDRSVRAPKWVATRTIVNDAARADSVKNITVTVVWTGNDGTTHTRSTTTRYAKEGLNDYFYTTGTTE